VGRFTVSPSELLAAANTLQGVAGELSEGGSGVGSLGAGDVGSTELAAALAEFCEKADAVASALTGAITTAGVKAGLASDDYVQADTLSIPGASP
jgi:1-aminocyclopropane-1-carboxylate deaminase/D-cysteine desulfhydrase-like pyridoxal-dependent ACC family enzyme